MKGNILCVSDAQIQRCDWWEIVVYVLERVRVPSCSGIYQLALKCAHPTKNVEYPSYKYLQGADNIFRCIMSHV